MIFFCEDCGEKNTLVPAQVIDGKAVFRCISCEYMNSYRFEPPRKTRPQAKEPLLNGTRDLPEITGFFLFHREKGVIKNHMSGTLKGTDLDILGKILKKHISDCRALFPDVNEMALVISNKSMLLNMLNKDLAIIIVGNNFCLD